MRYYIAILLLSCTIVVALDQNSDQAPGNTNNITYVNNTTYNAAGKYYEFNGFLGTAKYELGTNYNYTNLVALNKISNNFSFSVWMYDNQTTVTSNPTVLGQFYGAGAGSDMYGFYRSTNVLNFRLDNGTAQTTKSYTQAVYTGIWTNAIATVNTTHMCLYRNSTIQSSCTALSGRINNITSKVNDSLMIGGRGLTATSALTFNGSIDDVRVWNKSLTQEQVTAVYNNLSVSCSNLLAWYPFTNGTEICNSYCTYQGSGNWYMGGYESCVITTSTSVLNNQFVVNGSGTSTIINANITNVTSITAIGGAVITVSGGGRLG